MATVKEISGIFAGKGIHIKLPLPDNTVITEMEILGKQRYPDNTISLLLAVRFVDDHGKEIRDILSCQGKMDTKVARRIMEPTPLQPLKSEMLPQRDKMTFEDEDEVKDYLGKAIIHLLQDKGYRLSEQSGTDFRFLIGERQFFISLAVRCDKIALGRVRRLVRLRQRYGSAHDYGLVVPAIQESLGLPLRLQEQWLSDNEEYLLSHRIGIYCVDNRDPNRVYPLTIYPKGTEMQRYFMTTRQQWPATRTRYVESRTRQSGITSREGAKK